MGKWSLGEEMGRAVFVLVGLLAVVGLAEAGGRKLPKAVSLVQRQADEAVPAHASLRDEGMPEATLLVQRQAGEVVPPHASLRNEGMPEATLLVQRQAGEVVPPHASLRDEGMPEATSLVQREREPGHIHHSVAEGQ